MDGGVECESGACDGKGRSEQQSKYFANLCSPAGQKLWMALKIGLCRYKQSNQIFPRASLTSLFPVDEFSSHPTSLGNKESSGQMAHGSL